MKRARSGADSESDSCTNVPPTEQTSLVPAPSRQSATVTSAAFPPLATYQHTFTMTMLNVSEPFQVQAVCTDTRFDRIKCQMPHELEIEATTTLEKIPYWTNVRSLDRIMTVQFLPKNVHGTSAYEACLKRLQPDKCGLVKLPNTPAAPFMWLLRQKLEPHRHLQFYKAIKDINPNNRTEFLIGVLYVEEYQPPVAMPSTSQSDIPVADTNVPEVGAAITVATDGTPTDGSRDVDDSSQESDETICNGMDKPSDSHAVTIPTPPTHPIQSSPDAAATPIWRGLIDMVNVATFRISSFPFSGDSLHIEKEFPAEFNVEGRIKPDTVWDYIEKVKWRKEIILLRLMPDSDKDDAAYGTFLHYLITRKRLGVIRVRSTVIKEIYILPLLANKKLPSALLPLTGPGLEPNRTDRSTDLLVGIIVKSVTKRAAPTIAEAKQKPVKIMRREPTTSNEDGDTYFTPPTTPILDRASLIPPVSSKNQSITCVPGNEEVSHSSDSSEDDDVPGSK